MGTAGNWKRLRGIALALLGVFLAASACGEPKRDFKAPGSAGASGQAAVGGMDDADSGSSSVPSSASGTPAAGGAAGEIETAGGEAGAGGAPGPVVSACLPTTTRSCAEAGLLGGCAAGVQACGSDGMWGACSIAPKANDTCVPGNDDSCNGVANEGCGCVIGAERACEGAKGNCANGKQACPDGTWSACSIAPKAQDVCTPGDDANCNGTPNEGCACENGAVQDCGPTAVGICKPGKSTCSGGAWGSCTGAVVAAARDCSSALDNDCNGIADNTLDGVCQCKPTLQQACSAHTGLDGKGICKAGSQTCAASSNKSSSSWGSCTGSVGPAARDCSSAADNDCNGVTDNTQDSVCQCNPSVANSCATGGKCKSSGSATQCVACLNNTDCNNGTCSSANKCTCTPGYAGVHCEFLAFQGIGVPSGDSQSFANNVSHDGTIVVGYSSVGSTSPQHSLRWVNGVLTGIPYSAGASCVATAADANGVVVGRCYDGSSDSSYQYVNGTLTAISLAPNTGDIADISKDGKVSVGLAIVASNSSQQAFHRVNGSVSLLPKIDTDWSRALGVSGDGSVIVGEEYIFFHVGWFWSAATGTKQLAQSAAGFSNYYGTDVSTDGKVIVGYSNDGYAIRWSGASYAQYQTTPSSAYAATNQDGTASVGTLTIAANTTVAAIWDANGNVHQVTDYLTNSNLSGWTLTEATGISDDGKVVVGNGLYGGQSQGWIAHLP
ncbi:MAG: hypothetical protein ABJB12_15700 [Pseudomonadota bacterium]